MAKAGEHFSGIDQPKESDEDQSPDGDDIIAPSSRGEKHESCDENETYDDLVCVHSGLVVRT
jgi:hypothetical protein